MTKGLAKKQFYANKKGWIKSFESGFCQNEFGDYLPWMCYPLIEHLENNLKKSDIVFEFGFGTSTLFFAKRVQKVFAIETRKKWFDLMVKKAKDLKIKNIEIILLENGLEDESYEKMPQKILQNDYKKYADEVFDGSAEASFDKFDLIVIDSIKRAKSTYESISCLSENGRILLDDFERKSYKKIYDQMIEQGFEGEIFKGIAPAQIRVKEGVVFVKKTVSQFSSI